MSIFFFFKHKTAYEVRISDWSSDVCSSDLWADIWDVIGPQFEKVIAEGEGFSTFDRLFPMVRDGAVRETYWNYSFTPIRGESGAVAGVFNQGHETTERILYERHRRSEEHTYELQSLMRNSDAVFCLTQINKAT